jgi:hypothetical protein
MKHRGKRGHGRRPSPSSSHTHAGKTRQVLPTKATRARRMSQRLGPWTHRT